MISEKLKNNTILTALNLSSDEKEDNAQIDEMD